MNAPGYGTQSGEQGKARQRKHVQIFVAPLVAKIADDRSNHSGGQQITGNHPLDGADFRMEILQEYRKGHINGRSAQDGHKIAEKYRQYNKPER
ncbi:hypothetical protein D3C80_1196610 [compost metagenome]